MRYFEFIGEDLSRKSENAAKFWEVNLIENTVVVRYGRIGTNGQTKEKNFSTREEAEREVEKLVKEKTKKGYIEK
jgi:predicted DNA-binding WGR domain protein